MARKRDPNREKAFQIFKEHGGSITNREIANMLGIPEKTIGSWKSKSKDDWLGKLNLKQSDIKRKKRSTPKTEKYSNKKDIRSERKKQVIDSLVEAGTYSPALDLLIEIYLDAYEEYLENKNEKLRKELAKYLGQLGLDGKNKELIKKSGVLLAKGDEEKEKEPEPEIENNKLIQFRQRRMRG